MTHQELVAAFAKACDGRDVATVATLLAEDCRATFTGTDRCDEGMAAVCEKTLAYLFGDDSDPSCFDTRTVDDRTWCVVAPTSLPSAIEVVVDVTVRDDEIAALEVITAANAPERFAEIAR